MTHGQEETLQAFGDEIIPELSGAPCLSRSTQLLELRQALPLSFSPDGSTLLVASDLPGTHQLYALPARGGELEQLTDFAEPVSGFSCRTAAMLVEIDEGGNERTQLYMLGEGRSSRSSSIRASTTGRRTRRRTAAASRTRRTARNGVDFDIVVARPRERRGADVRARRLLSASSSISPDGRWVVAVRGNERAQRRHRPLPLRRRDGWRRARHAARGRGRVRLAAWHRRAGFCPRRTTAATRSRSSRGGESSTSRDWDLDCARRRRRAATCSSSRTRTATRGRRSTTRHSRSDEVPLPGDGVVEHSVFSPGRLAARVRASRRPVEPHDVYLYDIDADELAR